MEDNVAALRILENEAKQQQEAVASAKDSLQLFTNRYKGGVDTYLQVITAQTIELTNERNAIDIQRRRLDASGLLMKALGGGWNASNLPTFGASPFATIRLAKPGELEMKAIVMTQPGGMEVLRLVDQPEPVPGPDEVLVEVAAAGLNFMNIGVRRGQFWTDMSDPKILGVEGAGRALAVGSGVDNIQAGQRVAWVCLRGSYAERVTIPATASVPVPDEIDDHTAAAVMMQGLTASHFATDFHPTQPGDIALEHAAAGGVGLLLTQITKLKGRLRHWSRLVRRQGRCRQAGRSRSRDRRYGRTICRRGCPALRRGRRSCRL